jgi:hypothetical protein
VQTGRLAKDLAVAALMVAVHHASRSFLEDLRQTRLAFEKRQLSDVLAVDLDQIEGEIDERAGCRYPSLAASVQIT